MHLLVIRTSAMGDVALVTPVLTGFRSQYPELKLTLVTRSAFEQFFYSINNLELFNPDFGKRHKGFPGTIRLFSDLKRLDRFDHVIDLHDVLRSKIIRFLFLLSGVRSTVINKERVAKKRVISGKEKTQLKHSVVRYCDVFEKAGYQVTPEDRPCLVPVEKGLREIAELPFNMGNINIGVAPYAKHELKMWPEENMIKLLELISGKFNIRIWLFGGNDEKERLEKFSAHLPGSFLVTGKLSLAGELALMSRLNLMISMDSSNMHMAALSGTKVISLWGGTDPITGFGAWQQPDDYAIRIPVNELTCRPCTVYGKGKCRRGDFACMNWLTPEKVFEKILKLGLL